MVSLVSHLPFSKIRWLEPETDCLPRYLNTANFLRSIRNFKIDIRLTDPYAYVCAIHWQVSQATSLENIVFYMQFNSAIPGNTQQVSGRAWV